MYVYEHDVVRQMGTPTAGQFNAFRLSAFRAQWEQTIKYQISENSLESNRNLNQTEIKIFKKLE